MAHFSSIRIFKNPAGDLLIVRQLHRLVMLHFNHMSSISFGCYLDYRGANIGSDHYLVKSPVRIKLMALKKDTSDYPPSRILGISRGLKSNVLPFTTVSVVLQWMRIWIRSGVLLGKALKRFLRRYWDMATPQKTTTHTPVTRDQRSDCKTKQSKAKIA